MSTTRVSGGAGWRLAVSAAFLLALSVGGSHTAAQEDEASMRRAIEQLGCAAEKQVRSLDLDAGIGSLASEPARILAGYGRAAVPLLCEVLETGTEGKRREAIVTLGMIGRSAEVALPGLREHAGDPDAPLGGLSLLAMATILEDPGEMLPTVGTYLRLDSPPHYAVWASGLLREKSAPLASRLAELVDLRVHRTVAIWALGMIGAGASEVVPMLVRRYDDLPVGTTAIALGRIGDERGIEKLIAVFRESEYEIDRWSALRGLCQSGPRAKSIVPDLVNLLSSTSQATKFRAASALRGIGVPAPEAVPRLLVLAEQGEASLRLQAVAALGAVGEGSDAAIDGLVRLRADPDSRLAAAAEAALAQLGGNENADPR